MSNFKFNLGDHVKISSSGETGAIKSRAEHTAHKNNYQVHYKAADGRAVDCWWDEADLEKDPDFEEVSS